MLEPLIAVMVLVVPLATPDCPHRGAARLPSSGYATRVLVDRTVRDARRCASQLGWKFRVVERNNSPLPGTKDRRLDRVNVSVLNGRVVDVSIG